MGSVLSLAQSLATVVNVESTAEESRDEEDNFEYLAFACGPATAQT